MTSTRTYRYLRVALVGLPILLFVSVGIQVAADGLPGSISALYYTAARNVFVGVLVAAGVCLVALKGRGLDDLLLNVAGLTAPVVALTPTPLADPDADGRFAYRVPPGATDGVANGVGALTVVAVLGLVFAWWTLATVPAAQQLEARRGLWVATVLIVGFGAWFWLLRDSFLVGAHFAAALIFFGALVVVAWRSGKAAAGERRDRAMPMAMMTAQRREIVYATVSVLLGLAAAIGLLLGLLEQTGSVPIPHWLFWVETAMLSLFTVFWAVQTVEYWYDGAPST